MKRIVNYQRGGKERTVIQSISKVVWLVGLISLCDRAWEEELLTCHCACLNEPFHKQGGVFVPIFLLFLFLLPLSKIKACLVLRWGGVFILCVLILQLYI